MPQSTYRPTPFSRRPYFTDAASGAWRVALSIAFRALCLLAGAALAELATVWLGL